VALMAFVLVRIRPPHSLLRKYYPADPTTATYARWPAQSFSYVSPGSLLLWRWQTVLLNPLLGIIKVQNMQHKHNYLFPTEISHKLPLKYITFIMLYILAETCSW